jgi:hypothetical protein
LYGCNLQDVRVHPVWETVFADRAHQRKRYRELARCCPISNGKLDPYEDWRKGDIDWAKDLLGRPRRFSFNNQPLNLI